MAEDRGPRGKFARGRTKTGGRTKDSGFRIAATREAIEEALNNYPGGVLGYLEWLQKNEPRAFTAIWRDHIPKQVNVAHEGPIEIRWAGQKPRG